MRRIVPLVSTALLVAAAAAHGADPTESPAKVPTIERVQSIVTARCVDCHATLPTFTGVNSAPNGLVLEQPAQLKRHAERIGERVANGSMPPGNVTELTDGERAELIAWVKAARRAGTRR